MGDSDKPERPPLPTARYVRHEDSDGDYDSGADDVADIFVPAPTGDVHPVVSPSSASPRASQPSQPTVPPTAHPPPGDDASFFEDLMWELRSSAAGREQKHVKAAPAPLHLRLLQRNVQRFSRALQPYHHMVDFVSKVQRWDDPAVSAATVFVYCWLVYSRQMLFGLACAPLAFLAYTYYRAHGYLGKPLSQAAQHEKEPVSGIKDKFAYLSSIAQKVQNTLGWMSDYLEKVHNLATWQIPHNSWRVVYVLLAVLAAVILLPTKWLALLVEIGVGFKFFVVEALYARYPRLKAKHDHVAIFFGKLPRNVDIAGEPGRIKPMGPGAAATATDGKDEAEQSKETGSGTNANPQPSSPGETLRRRLAPKKSPSSSSMSKTAASPKRTTKADLEHQLLLELDVAPDEEIIEYWNCLDNTQGSLLHVKKGKLYLTAQHLCFVRGSDASGCYAIKLKDLVKVEKSKSTSVLQKGSLDIVANGPTGTKDRYSYAALLNRDETYTMICQVAKLTI